MVNPKIKSSTARRIAREAKERQAGVGAILAKGTAQKAPAGRSETFPELPGMPTVETPAAATTKPAKRTGGAQKKTPGEQTGRFTGPSSTAPRERSNLDMLNSSTATPQTATELKRMLDAAPLAGDELAEPMQDDLFMVMNVTHDWPVKDDISSMEHPLFSLSKNASTEIRSYTRGANALRIIPSGAGAPTIFDKDLLIYLISQITEATNKNIKVSRRIHINVTHFLKGTRRSTGGASYERVVDMCRRLRGTTIETNIRTTEEERTKGFGLIEDYEVKSATKNGKGALELEVTLSKWLYRAALEYKVLTLNPNYFSLSQALERRLYELARKHCGDQPWWEIGVDILQAKAGSEQSPRRFRQEIKAIVTANNLPDYRLGLDESCKPAKLVVMTADNNKLVAAANAKGKLSWIAQFLQKKLH